MVEQITYGMQSCVLQEEDQEDYILSVTRPLNKDYIGYEILTSKHRLLEIRMDNTQRLDELFGFGMKSEVFNTAEEVVGKRLGSVNITKHLPESPGLLVPYETNNHIELTIYADDAKASFYIYNFHGGHCLHHVVASDGRHDEVDIYI